MTTLAEIQGNHLANITLVTLATNYPEKVDLKTEIKGLYLSLRFSINLLHSVRLRNGNKKKRYSSSKTVTIKNFSASLRIKNRSLGAIRYETMRL